MTERELTKLILKCFTALKQSKGMDFRITSTTYEGVKINTKGDMLNKIVYHIVYYHGWESRQLDLDFPLDILEKVNSEEEKLALGQNIISRLYIMAK